VRACPALFISAPASNQGKTTVTAGLARYHTRQGLRVRVFKTGPDFLDPMILERASGAPVYSLHLWMVGESGCRALLAQAAQEADLILIEGVMGLFDGKSSPSLAGTTAEMAIWLDAAAVLVMDASAMAGSAAAIVHGFDTLVPELRLSAVVCNKVASAKHNGYLRDAIAARCRPALLGYLPRDASFAIPERHLGLHLAHEALTEDRLARLAEWVESHLDLDRLLELSAGGKIPMPALTSPARKPVCARIGIARDAAFCFYYHDNLELLRAQGAELIEFSPIADRALPPDLNGIYLGGGYPELHAAALSANESMRVAIAEFAASDAPVYAECGGFMYLTQAIVDLDGRNWPMAGIFPTSARMQKRLAKLGYIEVENCAGEGWLAPGECARGHEFRYSVIDPMPETICHVYREPAEGYRVRSVFGSYVHLHFLSCPSFAERFVRDCAHRRLGNTK
jgi:cobyrinic acid a,c-diamide synthase